MKQKLEDILTAVSMVLAVFALTALFAAAHAYIPPDIPTVVRTPTGTMVCYTNYDDSISCR